MSPSYGFLQTSLLIYHEAPCNLMASTHGSSLTVPPAVLFDCRFCSTVVSVRLPSLFDFHICSAAVATRLSSLIAFPFVGVIPSPPIIMCRSFSYFSLRSVVPCQNRDFARNVLEHTHTHTHTRTNERCPGELSGPASVGRSPPATPPLHISTPHTTLPQVTTLWWSGR